MLFRSSELVGAEQYRTFATLHAAMVERKQFADGDPIDLVPRMMAELPDALRPRVFVARHNGQPVAGAVIGVHGDTAYYLFGASNGEALPLKAGYALQWAIVQWLRGRSARWYDLGGEAGESGLRQFKKGLVGKHGAIIVSPGEYKYLPTLRARVATDLLMRIRGWRRAALEQLARAGMQ